MLKTTPLLDEYIEDYCNTRLWYLDILRRMNDKIEDEIASIKDAEPYQHEIHRREAIHHQRDYWFNVYKKLTFDAAETKTRLQYLAELINRRTKELGLDNIEVWKHISERF